MASNLVDLTKLGNALSRFKAKILNVAKPFYLMAQFDNTYIESNGNSYLDITSTAVGGVDLTQLTILGVVIQYAWPQQTWVGGAVVSINTYGMVGANLRVNLTTTSPQTYNLRFAIICVRN